MVQVTPQAIQHLAKVRSDRGLSKDAGARFIPKGPGVSFTFSDKPEPGDTVIEAPDLPIYVAQEAVLRLGSNTIDLSGDDGKKNLVLIRKKASAKAGAAPS